jgi:hypothetical protein
MVSVIRPPPSAGGEIAAIDRLQAIINDMASIVQENEREFLQD